MDILDEKGVLDKKIMNFRVNKTPVKVFKEGAFGGTYFRDIYPGVNGKWYRKSWKKLNQLKDVDHEFYCSDHYDVSVNKYGVKCRTSLRFWEDNGWINLQILMDGFSGILDVGWVEDQKMIKDKLINGIKS